MKSLGKFTIAGLLAAAVLAAAPLAQGAQPERLPQQPYEVRIVDGNVVEVTFTLVLSEVSNYPLTIFASRGDLEEVLWEGSLSEGVYRLRAPLVKIKGSGPIRVVLRTKMVSRSAQGTISNLVYLKWDGSI